MKSRMSTRSCRRPAAKPSAGATRVTVGMMAITPLTVSTTPLDLPVDLPGHDPEFAWLTRGGAEIPNEYEIQANPRAASARLRAAQRIREATS